MAGQRNKRLQNVTPVTSWCQQTYAQQASMENNDLELQSWSCRETLIRQCHHGMKSNQ